MGKERLGRRRGRQGLLLCGGLNCRLKKRHLSQRCQCSSYPSRRVSLFNANAKITLVPYFYILRLGWSRYILIVKDSVQATVFAKRLKSFLSQIDMEACSETRMFKNRVS